MMYEDISDKFKDKKFQKNILIYGVIFVIVIILVNWLIRARQNNYNKSEAESFSKYYQELMARCDNKDKKAYNCCFSSVAYMAAGNHELAPGLGCRFGFKLNTFNCQGSYKWCETIR